MFRPVNRSSSCNEYGSPNDSAYSEVAIIRANEPGKECDLIHRPGIGSKWGDNIPPNAGRIWPRDETPKTEILRWLCEKFVFSVMVKEGT